MAWRIGVYLKCNAVQQKTNMNFALSCPKIYKFANKKNVMRNTAIAVLVVLSAFFSCGNDSGVMDKLRRIHAVAITENYDSAYNMFAGIAPGDLRSDDEKALYGILRTMLYIGRDIPLGGDSLIDFSISYYEKQGPDSLLAQAFYYKGMSCYTEGSLSDAAFYMKKAEDVERTAPCPWLRNLIYGNLSYLNDFSGAYNIAMDYAKKALENAEKNKNINWICWANHSLAVVYYSIGRKDSALSYYEKIIPYMDKISGLDERVNYLSSIGCFYYELKQYDKAEPLFRNALELRSEPITNINYAEVCYALGKGNADSLLRVAWLDADYIEKEEILHFRADMAKKEGRYEESAELYKRARAMKDSAVMARNTENVLAAQGESERSAMLAEAADDKFAVVCVAVTVVALLVVSAVLFYRAKARKVRRAMGESRRLAAKYEQELVKAKAGESQNADMVARLERKIKEQRKRQAEILYRGRQLSGAVAAGGTTAGWSPGDFEAAVEYLRVKESDLVGRIERGHSRLTAYALFFLIVEDKWGATAETARIMNMSDGTVRTMRHRLRKRETED